MSDRRPWIARFATSLGWAVVVAIAGACNTSRAPGTESVGHSSNAAFTNGDFETGTAGLPPPSWTVQTYLNPNPGGVTITTPQTRAGLNLAPGGNALTSILNGVSQPDPDLGAGASLRWCRYGSQCAIVNFHSSNTFGNPNNVNSLSQVMTIGSSDVDPLDGQVHIRFTIAPVLQNPAHPVNQQPYYFVQLTNLTQSTILYTDFNLSAQPGVPWKTVNGGTINEIDYVDWSLVDIHPGSAALAMGDQVELEVIAGGCARGGHFGEVYVDGVGVTIPGIFVTGTGPAQANAGSNITYTLNYTNGSASAETGVVIDFTTPPNTTFQSITPPAGATCTTPAVGATGTIVCTFSSSVAAGASGSLTITVAIDAAATGTITAGTYDIHSDQETPLIGNKITTLIGCTADAQCPTGEWCDETGNACLATFANGTPMPTDPAHTTPTLDGTCSAAAAALVCTSGVCDTTDNSCGYLNGDGPCDSSNGATVCRSGVCDPDLKCGYAVGDGPCTGVTAPTVCRSGACSVSGVCEPVGGCDVDADCAPGNWCDESIHTCSATLPNGTPVPNDPPHTAPTLNGTCTPAAGTLVCTSGVCDATDNACGYLNGDGPCTSSNGGTVCRSGVCDPDLSCGYANGDGPCTTANAGTVCRSGVCSVSGLCEPAGGCDVDADCTGGNWCNESIHTCTPPLSNGTAMPTDPTHTSPTLDGTCTPAAATLVCASGVCDTADNKCGYANGDGPCSAGDGGTVTVCRSGACSVSGVCEPSGGCDVDKDCPSTQWCDESTHTCSPKIANGGTVPTDPPHTGPTLNGTCTKPAGTLVCVSGVCDTDNKCGYANGDGPCAAGDGGAGVCRSGACSVDKKCMPAGGCNVDGDCTNPGKPHCNVTAHTCVAVSTDGGMDGASDSAVDGGADGGADSGADGPSTDARSDAREDASRDARAAGDGPGGDANPDLSGFVEGGGCSCRATPGSAPGDTAFWAMAAGLLIVQRSRRQRSRGRRPAP